MYTNYKALCLPAPALRNSGLSHQLGLAQHAIVPGSRERSRAVSALRALIPGATKTARASGFVAIISLQIIVWTLRTMPVCEVD